VDTGKLVSFDGRVSRSTFWGVTVGALIIYVIGYLLLSNAGTIGVILGVILYLAAVIVSLAVSIKRWHDRNKSGWWIFISFVPLIGGIWALIETGFLAGTPGDNRYGAPASGSPFAS
jgi:uncharacterized membrane protein YhaH (DUF805 family)